MSAAATVVAVWVLGCPTQPEALDAVRAQGHEALASPRHPDRLAAAVDALQGMPHCRLLWPGARGVALARTPYLVRIGLPDGPLWVEAGAVR